MKNSLKGRDLLSLYDLTNEELIAILDFADELKAKQKRGEPHPYLAGKTLGMIFQKNSTRTRVSFEVGMYQLGGHALFLSSKDLQLGRGETIGDTAQTLSRYVDGIMIRTFSHDEVIELAEKADVPVINGLTDLLHPCQVLADLMTVREKKGQLKGLKLAFVGDGNNVAHSLLYGCARVGMDITVCTPPGYQPDSQVVTQAGEVAQQNGSTVTVIHDLAEALTGADVIYTDVWASMGQEQEREERIKKFVPYQINSKALSMAKEDVIVMHCLPAHRGEEITDEVIDGPHSVVFDEAENRLHAQKAVMAMVMG